MKPQSHLDNKMDVIQHFNYNINTRFSMVFNLMYIEIPMIEIMRHPVTSQFNKCHVKHIAVIMYT